jgi:hypothetical protein
MHVSIYVDHLAWPLVDGAHACQYIHIILTCNGPAPILSIPCSALAVPASLTTTNLHKGISAWYDLVTANRPYGLPLNDLLYKCLSCSAHAEQGLAINAAGSSK